MKINKNAVVEIAGGYVIGKLASDVFDGVVNVAVKVVKKQIKKSKAKKAEKENA